MIFFCQYCKKFVHTEPELQKDHIVDDMFYEYYTMECPACGEDINEDDEADYCICGNMKLKKKDFCDECVDICKPLLEDIIPKVMADTLYTDAAYAIELMAYTIEEAIC